MKKYLIFIILIFVVLIGCESLGIKYIQNMPKQMRTKTFNAEYKKVFASCIEWLNEKSFTIKADKETGLINTEWYEGKPFKSKSVILIKNRAKVNLFIKSIDKKKTKVVVTVRLQIAGPWADITVTDEEAKKVFNEIWTGIKNNL